MGSRVRPRGRRLLGGPRPRRARLFRGERGVGALLVFGLLALSVSALTSYTLPRLVEWRHNIGCVPGSDDGVACAPEMRHPDVDVVSVAVKPTCVTRVAVAALNQFVGPRRIHFVTADEARCEVLRGMASNVECHPEDRVVPGITKRAVAAELRRLHGLDADARYVGRETSGWYLQQLVKLGAAAHVPNLSETFLVWDPDMIALWPIKLFGARRGATGEPRALRHVGGYVIPSYEPSYRALTGDAMRRAPDGSSYVTHQMTMRREYVQEMLDAFAKAWDTTLKAASERTAVNRYTRSGGTSTASRSASNWRNFAAVTEERPTSKRSSSSLTASPPPALQHTHPPYLDSTHMCPSTVGLKPSCPTGQPPPLATTPHPPVSPTLCPAPAPGP